MLFDPKAQKMDGADPNEGENTQHGHMTGNMCVFQLPYRARVLPHAFQRP
jgi:hypothetical protein